MIQAKGKDKERLVKEINKLKADGTKTSSMSRLIDQQVKDSIADRDLKKMYAQRFVYILVGQLLVMNLVFILVGFKILGYEKWTLDLYMGGTLAEVFGVIFIITKNLFPKKND